MTPITGYDADCWLCQAERHSKHGLIVVGRQPEQLAAESPWERHVVGFRPIARGARFWRIRQSEVDRMLGEQASNRPAAPSGGPRPAAAEPARDLISSLITNPRDGAMQVEVASIVKQMTSAGERWESALDAHALAPPDAGFPVRLRALSNAAAEQAAAFELAAQGGLGWRSRTVDGEFSLAPELTPGRTRPGPPELWERFDAATASLAAALAGSSPKMLAEAFTKLSEVSGLLATDLQRTYRAATSVAS